MASYDLCVLFSGRETEQEADEHAKKIDELLSQAKAETKYYYSLGRRKLAYKINGETHGEYRVWLFNAEPETIPELDEKLRHAPFVVRHLVIRLEDVTIEERIERIENSKTRRALASEQSEQPEEKRREPKPVVEEKPAIERIKPVAEKDSKKVSIDQLDEKLDELLKDDKI